MKKEHNDLVEIGIEMVNPNEYKVSNKFVNYLALFCFTSPAEVRKVVNIINETNFGENSVFKEFEEEKSEDDE